MMTNAKLVFFILWIQLQVPATNSANALLTDHDVNLEHKLKVNVKLQSPVTVTASKVADTATETGTTSETIHEEVEQQRSLTTKWRYEAFPNPERDAKACGGSIRICDPDFILQEAEMNDLEERIEQLERSQMVACSDAKVPIEVAVAIVQMVRTRFCTNYCTTHTVHGG